jgi:magnesium chelatase subunit D
VSPFDPTWEDESDPPAVAYADPIWAAAVLAVDPAGLGGVAIRAWSGPARDGFLHRLTKFFPAGTPVRKLPLSVTDDRLLGGLDLAATLQAGKPVFASGVLAEAEHGVLVLAMAERLTAGTAARIAAASDTGAGFAMVALDEGIEADEAPPAALLERMAFTVNALPGDSEDWPEADEIAAARAALPGITVTNAILEQICGVSAALGVGSMRAPLFTLRAARALAALRGADAVATDDVAIAVRLVLVPRATQMPSAPEEQPEDQTQEDQPEPEPENQEQDQALEDSVADAEQALLPPELLAALAAGLGPRRTSRGGGKGGATISLKRGRPAGTRRGALGGEARLSIIDTLRAAAPWQALRRAPGRKISVRADDFRIKKFKEDARTIAIFAVDASGSSAVNRLSEAKGAIQLLLADCYVRRDQVALLAFRGKTAECLLPPTHALARAKRALAGLPGGGPTPLATGIDAARAMAEAERRKGHKPLIVLLTDGGANIGRDQKPGRAAAGADALAAGKLCRAGNFAALVVDTAPRPQAFVKQLAADMAAKYLPLPYADAGRLSQAVRAQGGENGRFA